MNKNQVFYPSLLYSYISISGTSSFITDYNYFVFNDMLSFVLL